MSYEAVADCVYFKYDSTHNENYCSNEACPRDVTGDDWGCDDGDMFFKLDKEIENE